MFGTSEVALRALSLVSMLGACVGLAKLGEVLLDDREIGLFAALVLATSWNAFREAVDARPYALGSLALTWAAVALVRWIRGGEWRDAVLLGVLAGFLPHAHPFFALPLVAFGYFAWSAGSAEEHPGVEYRRQQLVIAVLLSMSFLLSLPVLSRYVRSSERSIVGGSAELWRSCKCIRLGSARGCAVGGVLCERGHQA